jgi:hypothetical protein
MSEPTQPVHKWSIKKEISIGDVGAMVLAAFAIITAYFSLDKRITLVEGTQAKQEAIDRAQDAAQIALKYEFSSWLIRIESKLDRLFDGSDQRKNTDR